MKRLLSIISLVLITLNYSCTKNSSNEEIIPKASFKINNLMADGWALEGKMMDIQNTSSDVESYYWDFGNGLTSTEKDPTNLYFSSCGAGKVVTLTVKSKSGNTVVLSQTFNVACSGKTANGSHTGVLVLNPGK